MEGVVQPKVPDSDLGLNFWDRMAGATHHTSNAPPPALLRTKASQINILQAIHCFEVLASHPYEELGRLKLMMMGAGS